MKSGATGNRFWISYHWTVSDHCSCLTMKDIYCVLKALSAGSTLGLGFPNIAVVMYDCFWTRGLSVCCFERYWSLNSRSIASRSQETNNLDPVASKCAHPTRHPGICSYHQGVIFTQLIRNPYMTIIVMPGAPRLDHAGLGRPGTALIFTSHQGVQPHSPTSSTPALRTLKPNDACQKASTYLAVSYVRCWDGKTHFRCNTHCRPN